MIREAVIQAARDVIDWTAADAFDLDLDGAGPPYKPCEDKGTGQGFRELLGPPPAGGDWDLARPFRAWLVDGKWRTEGVSTCGLICAGVLRRAGAQLPWAGRDYWHFGGPFEGLDIVSALGRLGSLERAVRPAGVPPEPGDPFCIGSGLRTHVATCIERDGDLVVSVDGGQARTEDRWLQSARRCERAWSKLEHVWVLDVVQLWASLEAQAVYP